MTDKRTFMNIEKPILDLNDSLVFRRIIAVADFIRPFTELPRFKRFNSIINNDAYTDDQRSNAYNEQMVEIYEFIKAYPPMFDELMRVANE